MNKKRYFSAQVRGCCMKGLLFIAAFAFIVAMPRFSSGKAASTPSVDEAQPSNIPQEIIDDWKAKGRTDVAAAHTQRVKNIKPFLGQIQKMIYMNHFNIGGAIFGYTEDLNSDGSKNIGGKFDGMPATSKGTAYKSGAKIMKLEFKNYYPKGEPVLEDSKGVLRDPCVWFDGSKMVFAWAKNNNGYNLYELNFANPSTQKQITANPTGYNVSDFEPCYCPDSDIVFVSSRCMNHVDCNFNLSSNLYICNKEGKYLRRISYDQVNIFRPTCTEQGLILYSRWEYNDRDVMDAFGIFTMNPDGSHQTEYFGNQLGNPSGKPCASWCPGGNGKFFMITSVHMGSVYQGHLVLVDPLKGRNSSSSCTGVAGSKVSASLADGDRKFQDPYALSDEWFLISYTDAPSGGGGMMGGPPTNKYGLYLMNTKGDRELLAWDANMSCCQPFPMLGRENTPIAPRYADYRKTTGTVMVTNAYYGNGAKNVAANSIKKIRAIALNYRVNPWIGNTGKDAYTATPVARYGGSWESKRVLGEMKVESDGSAAMILPARTPIYFQLIDQNNCMIQSVRSWFTLMPGERFSCSGCHEDKNAAALSTANMIAKTPKELDPVIGKKDFYLHWVKIIQPIIDAKCLSCHKSGGQSPDLTGTKFWTGDLSDDADNKTAERYWLRSYYNLSASKYVSYINIFSMAAGLSTPCPGSGQSVKKSGSLMYALKNKPGQMSSLTLTDDEFETFALWMDLCIPHSGDYMDDMKEEHKTKYLARLKIRQDMEAVEAKNIEDCLKGSVNCIPSGDTHTIQVYYDKTPISNRNTTLFDVQCLANGKRLVLRLPGEGNIALMDMLGRQIMTQSVSKDAVKNAVIIRTKLPRGLYIVKFKGAAVTEHRVINVL